MEYIKDGIILEQTEIVIKKTIDNINTVTYNPSHDMLLEDGWSVYIPSDELLLQQAKDDMIKNIMEYDSSDSVNIFYIQNLPVWLDKDTRAGLKLRFEAEIASGQTETSLWYNNMQFPLSLENAIKMLYAIEIYASQCYDNTHKHIANINSFTTIAEINSYDYTLDYPDKLYF